MSLVKYVIAELPSTSGPEAMPRSEILTASSVIQGCE